MPRGDETLPLEDPPILELFTGADFHAVKANADPSVNILTSRKESLFWTPA